MAKMNGIFVPDDGGEWYYRGIAPGHVMIAAARQRVVIPGERDGTISALRHDEGLASDFAVSPFTSWTTDHSLALDFADDPPGIVLRLPRLPVAGTEWNWEGSPDESNENEVLLRGVRIDAEVVP